MQASLSYEGYLCIPEVQVLHGACGDQRLLGVVQHIGLGVHTGLVVGDIHAHGLLAHSRLVRVPGGLVVVREGDDGGTHPKDHGRVDLTVGEVGGAGDLGVVPGVGQVCNVHGYHGGFLLFCVQIPADGLQCSVPEEDVLWLQVPVQ